MQKKNHQLANYANSMMMQFDLNFKRGSRRERVLKAKKIVKNTSRGNTYLLCQVGNAIVPNVCLVGPTR